MYGAVALGPAIMSFGMVLFLMYHVGKMQKELIQIKETLKQLQERDK